MKDYKKLYRSRTNRTISGVCGGIAEFFNIDPTIVRLIALLALIPTALIGGVIAYIVCTAVIPEKP